MATVVVAPSALGALDRMVRTHSLPADTRARVVRSLRGLAEFPLLGAPLDGRWADFRFVLGPWRWMLIVYTFEENRDLVVVVAFHDARSSTAATGAR